MSWHRTKRGLVSRARKLLAFAALLGFAVVFAFLQIRAKAMERVLRHT